MTLIWVVKILTSVSYSNPNAHSHYYHHSHSLAGDTHLGGEDFDQRMMDHCIASFKKKHGLDLTGDPKVTNCWWLTKRTRPYNTSWQHILTKPWLNLDSTLTKYLDEMSWFNVLTYPWLNRNDWTSIHILMTISLFRPHMFYAHTLSHTLTHILSHIPYHTPHII